MMTIIEYGVAMLVSIGYLFAIPLLPLALLILWVLRNPDKEDAK